MDSRREKQVKIPMSLFEAIYRLVLLAEDLDKPEIIEIAFNEIRAEIMAKVVAIEARVTFTDYKTCPPGEDRERYRLKYLDEKGIGKGFRTNCEVSRNEI